MKKYIQLFAITLLFISCKSSVSTSNEVIKIPYFGYQQQKENLEKGIYFRGNGNEPEWSLKIADKGIEFTSLLPGFEKLTANHVEPVRAMDANVKMYRVATDTATMIIQIMQQECTNTMSGLKSAYSVRIEMLKDSKSTFFNGCGNYITDSRLHDIWVLEELNGKKK